MRKFFLVILIAFLASCTNNSIKLPTINHLTLFSLNGNVKKINYTFNEYEITPTSYVKKGKFTPFQNGLILFDFDCNVEHPLILSNFGKYSFVYETFDAFNIAINNINDEVFSEKCDSYELEFNQSGFLLVFSGTDTGKIVFKKELKYDNQDRLIYIKNFSEGKTWTNTYEYNSENLVKLITSVRENYKTIKKFEYIVDNANEIKVKMTTDNSEVQNSKLILNDKTINEIVFDNLSSVKFKNGLISSKNRYNNGSLEFASDYTYENNLLSKVKISEKNYDGNLTFKDYSFTYNVNSNIVVIKKNISDNQRTENVNFDYELDNKNNWTRQSYGRQRSMFDNQQKKVNQLIELNNNYLELYGYPAFPYSETENEFKRLSLAKLLSSKLLLIEQFSITKVI